MKTAILIMLLHNGCQSLESFMALRIVFNDQSPGSFQRHLNYKIFYYMIPYPVSELDDLVVQFSVFPGKAAKSCLSSSAFSRFSLRRFSRSDGSCPNCNNSS